MSLNPKYRGRDQIEFAFVLTFEKILHVPKRSTEIQILWTRGKATGASSIATVTSNMALWDVCDVNSIKVVSNLFKDPSCSSFLHKSLFLEVVAVQNKKVISTLAFCTLNLADYVGAIYDALNPSPAIQIYEKMSHGAVACILITAQLCRIKRGEWQPTGPKPSNVQEHAKCNQMKAASEVASMAVRSLGDQSKRSSTYSNRIKISDGDELSVKIIERVDDGLKHASMYIGDVGIELLLRVFSKYDWNRSGRFEMEQVACMLSDIGQISAADDLRSGKTAISHNFNTSDGAADGVLHMNFNSFASWIAANNTESRSKLQLVRSIREVTKGAARDKQGTASISTLRSD